MNELEQLGYAVNHWQSLRASLAPLSAPVDVQLLDPDIDEFLDAGDDLYLALQWVEGYPWTTPLTGSEFTDLGSLMDQITGLGPARFTGDMIADSELWDKLRSVAAKCREEMPEPPWISS